MNFYISKKRGFTTVEVLVVIAVLVLLASVVLANMQQVRMKGRDAQRMSDMENIQLALRLYKDAYGKYPTGALLTGTEYNSGIVIGDGGTLDTLLLPYMTKVPSDPLGTSGVTYKYWYDSDYDCVTNGENTILFVKTAELSANQGKWKGKGATCQVSPMGQITANSYGIILK